MAANRYNSEAAAGQPNRERPPSPAGRRQTNPIPALTLLLLTLTPALHSEIVDRIAATIGFDVITGSQVVHEIRLTAFMEASTPDLSPESKRKTLERLIEQTLIRREVRTTRFQPPAGKDVEPLLAQLKARFQNEANYREALEKYEITEADVLARLAWQLTMLRFIEYRFQPSVHVTDAEIHQEYRKQSAAWREKNSTPPPPIEKIRPEIEKIVVQRLTDSALDNWLGEMRTQNTILYREGYK